MYKVNDDMSIYVTRGDAGGFTVEATIGEGIYTFRAGDKLRFKVFGKKDCENVVLQRDFDIVADTTSVQVYLTGADTKIGEVISKPVDYWYEIELNPTGNPQTIVGYDADGAKVFRLFPEGKDMTEAV